MAASSQAAYFQHDYTALDSVLCGASVATALRDQVESLGAERVFLLGSASRAGRAVRVRI